MVSATRPRRRFLQFRLRTLLVIVLLLAAPLGWVTNRRRKQDQAIATIESLGGRVEFRWKNTDDYRVPPHSKWLRRLVGDPWLAQSIFVSFRERDARVRNADLACLAELPHLTALSWATRASAIPAWSTWPSFATWKPWVSTAPAYTILGWRLSNDCRNCGMSRWTARTSPTADIRSFKRSGPK